MSKFIVELVESELKIILEALTEKESRMSAICDTSDDPDEISDIGNDLIELRLLLNPLKERAISAFGRGILNFDRTAL